MRFDLGGCPTTLSLHVSGGAQGAHIQTFLVAAFERKSELDFEVHRKGSLTITIGQDVKTGDNRFDRAFILKCDDELKVEELLAESKLRDSLIDCPAEIVGTAPAGPFFTVYDDLDYPEIVENDPDLGVLFVQNRNGAVKDIAQLLAWLDVTEDLLDRLVAVGWAVGEPSGGTGDRRRA